MHIEQLHKVVELQQRFIRMFFTEIQMKSVLFTFNELLFAFSILFNVESKFTRADGFSRYPSISEHQA